MITPAEYLNPAITTDSDPATGSIRIPNRPTRTMPADTDAAPVPALAYVGGPAHIGYRTTAFGVTLAAVAVIVAVGAGVLAWVAFVTGMVTW
jgi:hypothetical protein